MPPTDILVKLGKNKGASTHPVGIKYPTLGIGFVATDIVVVSAQPLVLSTTKETSYVPATVKTCCGLTTLVGGDPSPKFHSHELLAAPPLNDKSLKVEELPGQTGVELKFAIGPANTFTF